ncbi:DUF4258 domain-containing protein [Nocardioides sp. Y6]|uniref:DUF4258 domain-containing protein n=1 Tax=Nocardioides malaquae TaxID=2773426 RepID=A0ABR9RWT4_9ACTN|nr:KH domain-containing protein [Nocardioides malaquae]MBE7326034.1 DUF4258 domain-containing protein [Nocardioides malaquae]
MSTSTVALVLAALAALTVGVVVLLRRRPRDAHTTRPAGLPPATRLCYTRHLRERMAQRGVSSTEVEQTLSSPDRLEHDVTQQSMRFEKDFPEKVLKVWVAREPGAAWPPADAVVKSTAWAFTTTLEVRPDSVGRLIGRRGATIQSIRQATGARIWVKDNVVHVRADDGRSFHQAKERVLEVTRCA